MVSLEVDGARCGRIGMDRAGGWGCNRLVINDCFTIEDDGDVSIDQGDIVTLPLVADFPGIFQRWDEVEDRPYPL